jgi:hypothetical protein
MEKSSDTKEALTHSAAERKPLVDVIHDRSRSTAAPPIPFHAAKPQVVENGFLDVEQRSFTEPLTTSIQPTPPTPDPYPP